MSVSYSKSYENCHCHWTNCFQQSDIEIHCVELPALKSASSSEFKGIRCFLNPTIPGGISALIRTPWNPFFSFFLIQLQLNRPPPLTTPPPPWVSQVRGYYQRQSRSAQWRRCVELIPSCSLQLPVTYCTPGLQNSQESPQTEQEFKCLSI